MLPIIFRGHDQSGFFVHAQLAHATNKLLTRLPGNTRTDEARYACIVPVRDYPRMFVEWAHGRGEWHYSDLEPEILEDVRAERAVIILDLCNEGPSYSERVFDELYAWIEAQNLPAGRVIWMDQNRRMAADARKHVGDRAALVRFEPYDFFVRAMAWLYSPHGEAPLLGRDVEAATARLLDPAAKSALLLCLNATPRLHRVLTVAALEYHGLIEGSLVSFPGLQYVKEGASIDAVVRFVEGNQVLNYLRPTLDKVREMADLRVDSFEEKGNALFSKVDAGPYERSYFSLVTESDFSHGEIDRVSEKIAKSYAMGHPTLLVGNPESVKFMTELGFQDWDRVFDRSYETISNPAERFETVMREVLRQALRVRTNPAGWMASVHEVSAFNIRHAMSGKMLEQYIERYDVPLVARLKALVGL